MELYDDTEGDLDNEIFGAQDLFDEDIENKNNISGPLEADGNTDSEDGIGKETRDEPKLKSVTKRVVKNPRVFLNFERLRGPNGLKALNEVINMIKFKGKHKEKEDLTTVMKYMQHWMCHYLYPGYDAETCMRELERLGRKRAVQTYVRSMRKEEQDEISEDKDCPAVDGGDIIFDDTDFMNVLEGGTVGIAQDKSLSLV